MFKTFFISLLKSRATLTVFIQPGVFFQELSPTWPEDRVRKSSHVPKEEPMTCCDRVRGRQRLWGIICSLCQGLPVSVHCSWDSAVTGAKHLFLISFSKRSHQRCADLLLDAMLWLDHEVNVWTRCRVCWFWAGLRLWSVERLASLPSKPACRAAFITPQILSCDPPDLKLQIKDKRKTGSFKTKLKLLKEGACLCLLAILIMSPLWSSLITEQI